jgi:hypothetical protein
MSSVLQSTSRACGRCGNDRQVQRLRGTVGNSRLLFGTDRANVCGEYDAAVGCNAVGNSRGRATRLLWTSSFKTADRASAIASPGPNQAAS